MNHAVDIESSALKTRRAAMAEHADVLADIYQEDVNLAVWQRQLPSSLRLSVAELLLNKPKLALTMTLAAESATEVIHQALGGSQAYLPVATDIAELVDMFCCLFDLERAALRLSVLNAAMCPKFHVDRVPCRLVTTYQEIATEWLPHAVVDRSKLGAGSVGLRDSESGIYRSETDIQQLCAGEVALLKGENWLGNEQAGLVHRSPEVPAGRQRLLLTLDFSA